MRRTASLVLLLALALVACADTVQPPTPTTALTTTVPSPPSTRALIPTASSPEPQPSLQPTLTISPRTASPWPSFVRELDFGIAAGNSYGPQALAVHPGLDRIYARTRNQYATGPGQITVLDRATGQVLALAETGLDSYAEGDLVVDPGQNRVYAVNTDESSATILDASTLELLRNLEGVDHLALDARAGRLYVAGLGGLRSLDAQDYRVLQETDVAYAPRFLRLVVEPTAGRLFLAWEEGGSQYLAQYDADTLQELAISSLPGRPDDMVPDPSRSLVYLTLNDGERNLLWALDETGQLEAERVLGEWSQRTHLALDPATDLLLLGKDHYNNYAITLLELDGWQEAADIPLDLPPNALLWDAQSGHLLVSHTYADKIRVVDTHAGRTVGLFPTALDLVDLAVDPSRGHLYVTDTAGSLHVLDSETDKTLSVLPGEGLIALDSPHGRVYAGGDGAERLRIYDADTLQQTGQIETQAKPVADAYLGGLYLVQNGIYIASLDTLTITGVISDTLPQAHGYSPNPSAVDAMVDPGNGRLFAIINNGTPGSNSGTYLYVYEPVTYEKVLTDTERSPLHLDIDPTTGQAYVSRIHLAGRSTSLLDSGREYIARLESVFGALRVDPSLNRVFLSVSGNEEGYLLVLDARNLDVLGSVPIPGGFELHALDPRRSLLYLTTSDGRVQVWSTTGGRQVEPHEPSPAHPPAEEIHRLFRGPQDAPIFTGSLYRSDDQGNSWQRIDAGLPRRGVQQLVVSPAFVEDRTLFAALSATDEGLGVWKSTDGGWSWRMANRGLTDLAITDLAISPNYAHDQTLFATARKGGLFRSEDGGQLWIPLTDRYYPADAYPQSPGGVFLSPTYGLELGGGTSRAYTQDRTVFVSHEGLYRSTDGGETWEQTLRHISSLALSPDFARDQTAFGWTGEGGLFRSTDGGDTWQSANAGLILGGYGWGRALVSPEFPTSQTVYFIWTGTSPDAPAQFFRSLDAADSWEQLMGQAPQGATPIELSADGRHFLALDRDARLNSWAIDELNWQAAKPSIDEIELYELILSPGFFQDRTLYALSEGAGILRSVDAGLTWGDTGFPLRGTSGLRLTLTLVPPEWLFVGTPLGLYRSRNGGTWSLVGGGLPGEVRVSTPQIGADGSLRVLVGDPSDSQPQRVYLSTDAGQTWISPIPALPQAAILEDLLLSPGFAQDLTAFLAPSPGKPLRTSGGTDWQTFGPPGQWELSALQLSPDFARDRLLIVRLQENSLWRSTDAGENWAPVGGPWGQEAPIAVTQSSGYRLDAVTFSPVFAEDGVMLTQGGDVLYRSTDTGITWSTVLDLEPSASKVTFSPDYLQDRVIYLLQGNALLRSIDRGQTWQALPPPPWSGSDPVQLLPSPTFSVDNTLLAWSPTGLVFQSQTGGQSWREISNGLPTTGIRQIAFSPAHASDELLYLVPTDPGLYKRVGNSPWMPSSARALDPTPTPGPAITQTPPSGQTPSAEACAIQPELLEGTWAQIQPRLGCPEQPLAGLYLAEQAFEHGRMIWNSATKQIYVLTDSNQWLAFDDTFEEGVDPAYDPALPPPPQQPQRGFGKVWREQLGGVEAAIGWALEGERPVNGFWQRFQKGSLFWTDTFAPGATAPGTAYLLYNDGTWQLVSGPGP